MNNFRRPYISASIMCADILNLGASLNELEKEGIDYIHCDVMDNHFVPNLMLPPELLNKLHEHTTIPFDYHLMTEKPETVIPMLKLKENDIVSVHYESTHHLQRLITMIKDMGAKAAVAINPATPIEVLSEILPEIDMVLIMTVNPGFAGQKLCPGALDKIKRSKNMLIEKNLSNILIQVDGNCSFDNIPKMYDAGADIFVAGTSSIFNGKMSIHEAVNKIMLSVNNYV